MPSVNAREVAHRGLQVVHEPLQLAGSRQRARLRDPREARPSIVAGVSRTPGIISSAQARVAGRRRSGRRAPGWPPRAPRAAGAIVSRRLPCSAASAPIVMLKLRDQVLAAGSRGGTAPRRPSAARRPASTGRAAPCRASASFTTAAPRSASAEYSSESFSASPAGLALDVGILVVVLAGLGLAVERLAVADQQLLQVLARVGRRACRAPGRSGPAPTVCEAGIVSPSSSSGAPRRARA